MTMQALSNKPLNLAVEVGSKVRCLTNISFLDGENHNQGMTFTVTEDTLTYYRTFCNNKDYALIKHDDEINTHYFD